MDFKVCYLHAESLANIYNLSTLIDLGAQCDLAGVQSTHDVLFDLNDKEDDGAKHKGPDPARPAQRHSPKCGIHERQVYDGKLEQKH